MNTLFRFFENSDGQDLVEYALLLAFICLVGAAAFIGMGASVNGIWTVVNSRMAACGAS